MIGTRLKPAAGNPFHIAATAREAIVTDFLLLVVSLLADAPALLLPFSALLLLKGAARVTRV